VSADSLGAADRAGPGAPDLGPAHRRRRRTRVVLPSTWSQSHYL